MRKLTYLIVIGLFIFISSCSVKNENLILEDKSQSEIWNDSIAQNHYNSKNDSLNWDLESLKSELAVISEPSILPITYGVYPTPDYNLLGKDSFKGLGISGMQIKVGDKTVQYTGFFVKKNEINKDKIGNRNDNVFFNIIVLTDTLSPENRTLNEGHVISRNHPNYIGQGSVITKNNKIDYVAFHTIEDHSYAIVNMRLFDLKYGNTILIAPQKDQSLRSMQLDISNLEFEQIDSKINDLLEKENVSTFFMHRNNI